MNDKKINWLQNWFFQNFDEMMKKKDILLIENIDNPSWSFTLKLGSKYKLFNDLEKERTEIDWCHCFIRDHKYESRGGPLNLNEMLKYFINFIENKNEPKSTNIAENEIIDWMENWYYQQCDEDWEHSERFIIKTTESGWFFSIYLEESIYEEKSFEPIEVKKSENDWYRCYRTKYRFEGKGGIFNLTDILNVFINWVEGYKN
jgi:hypothetical protein